MCFDGEIRVSAGRKRIAFLLLSCKKKMSCQILQRPCHDDREEKPHDRWLVSFANSFPGKEIESKRIHKQSKFVVARE